MKRRTREKQQMLHYRVGLRLIENFKENKKLFWSGVNRKRKEREQMDFRIIDADGEYVTEERTVLDRWSGYFKQLLNFDDGRVAVLNDERMNEMDEMQE